MGLSKQIELENPALKQEINFIQRLERDEGAQHCFSSLKNSKNKNDTAIKFEINVTKANLCYYLYIIFL